MKGSDPNVPGAVKKVEKLKLVIDKACDHHVQPPYGPGDKVKLKKKNRDALEWTITNDCPSDQEVLFCVYDAETKVLVDPPPFGPYKSTKPDLKVGKIFTVESNEKVTLECTAKNVGEYRKLVLVGKEASKGCEPTEPVERTHRLGVHIVN